MVKGGLSTRSEEMHYHGIDAEMELIWIRLANPVPCISAMEEF